MTRYREQVAVRLPKFNHNVNVEISTKRGINWFAVCMWCFAIPALFVGESYTCYEMYQSVVHSQPGHTVCR